ncbi:MAG: Lrp/AsnC family transcriptional regulator [Tepidimonas fonticaldi]|nr:Lrp/AsnC family transcriptional regulator [Tepidimonas fonticaldi]
MSHREHLDATDRRLVKALSADGQQSVNELAERLGVSPPTVRARLRALVDKGALRIVGQLNLAERPELISAIVGINASDPDGLGNLANKLAELPSVVSVSIVTGRFDLIVEVLIAGDIHDLYLFTSEDLPKVAGRGVVSRSETFVVMKSREKWVNLPRGCWDEPEPGPSDR